MCSSDKPLGCRLSLATRHMLFSTTHPSSPAKVHGDHASKHRKSQLWRTIPGSTPFTSASSPCVAAPLCLNGPPGSTVLPPLHGGPSSPSWTFLSRAQGTECQADWRCRTLAAHRPGSGPSQLASTVTGTGRPSLSTVTSQWLEREQHQSLPHSVSLSTEVPHLMTWPPSNPGHPDSAAVPACRLKDRQGPGWWAVSPALLE